VPKEIMISRESGPVGAGFKVFASNPCPLPPGATSGTVPIDFSRVRAGVVDLASTLELQVWPNGNWEILQETSAPGTQPGDVLRYGNAHCVAHYSGGQAPTTYATYSGTVKFTVDGQPTPTTLAAPTTTPPSTAAPPPIPITAAPPTSTKASRTTSTLGTTSSLDTTTTTPGSTTSAVVTSTSSAGPDDLAISSLDRAHGSGGSDAPWIAGVGLALAAMALFGLAFHARRRAHRPGG
jgi:hypothetical protein